MNYLDEKIYKKNIYDHYIQISNIKSKKAFNEAKCIALQYKNKTTIYCNILNFLHKLIRYIYYNT